MMEFNSNWLIELYKTENFLADLLLLLSWKQLL